MRHKPAKELTARAPLVRARVWLEFPGGAAMGEGRVALLEAIAQHGSITRAARAIGVSYRAAWRWIQQLGHAAGAPLVETAAGGVRGGGTSLTRTGEAALAVYRRAAREITRLVERLCDESAGSAKEAAPRSADRSRRRPSARRRSSRPS